MPLVYDPDILGWRWTGEEETDFSGRAALAGQIVSGLTPAEQFDIGAEAAMPGYQESPYTRAYAQRSIAPMYGRFLAAGAPGEWTGEGAPPTFAQYTRSAMTGARGGQPLVTNLSTQNWQDIMDVARSQALGYEAPSGGAPSDVLAAKWGPMLRDPQQVAALTAMATYDPYAGSIYGGLRQRGLDVMRRRFLAGDADPASAGSRWLTHLMGGAGGAYINPAYQYTGRVPTGATGITPATGSQDPGIIGGTIDDPIYATEPPGFPAGGGSGELPAGGVNPNRPTMGDFASYVRPPGAQWYY
jgi:hypothetical protein